MPDKLLRFLLETYGDLILQDLRWETFVKFVQLDKSRQVLILQHCFPVTKQVANLISSNLKWLLREELMKRFTCLRNVPELDLGYLSKIRELEGRTQMADLSLFLRNQKFASYLLKLYGPLQGIPFPELMEISKGLEKFLKDEQDKLLRSKPDSIDEVKRLLVTEKEMSAVGLASITHDQQYQIRDTLMEQAEKQLGIKLRHEELSESEVLEKACKEIVRLTKLTPLAYQRLTAGLALKIASMDTRLSIFDIPPGCGKTLILLLLATALSTIEVKRVLYLTPNDYLKIVAYKLVEGSDTHSAQPDSMAKVLHMTFNEYLNSDALTDFCVVLIDEFDEFLHAASAFVN